MSVTETESQFNGCRVVRLTPENPVGTMVWFHGGGWMIELGEDALQWGRDLAERTHLTVLMPDYPLARAFAYPKSNAWCVDFWRYCLQHESGPIYLGGDSAGAHLALCSLPGGWPEKALFIYAVTTLLPVRESGSWAAFKKGWPLSPRLMDYFYDAYCPNKEMRMAASPLEQLERIPQTLLITASDDILADQQAAFAYRFGAQQIVYEGAGHIFLSRAEGAAFRARALDDAATFLAAPKSL
jgi:acetyl esterase